MTNTDQHWSNYYDQGKDFGLITAQAITKLLSYVDDDLPKTNLDIGCGTGQLTRELYHRGYTCLGVDASAKALEIARSLTMREGLEYRQFDVEAEGIKSLSDQSYTLITCKLVYVFIKDKASFLSKVTSVLAERGIFVIITPLTTDVPPEKAGIAIDFDQTIDELRAAFKKVQLYPGQGVTYFVCSK